MAVIVAALTAFTFSALLVPVAGALSRALGIVARPIRDRWHERAVPKFGGLAMLVPLVAVVAFEQALPVAWPVILSATAMFAVGLLDDVHPIKPAAKFALQLLVAVPMLFVLPSWAITTVPWIDRSITLVWIIGLTNASNLLDNMDGLTGGVATIAALGLLGILSAAGSISTPHAVVLAAFAGAVGGFLLYNFHPASIFMGDSGSHLIGGFLAAATLTVLPQHALDVGTSIVPLLLMLVPICDTGFVIVTRGLAGRSAFIGGKDHLSHRLVLLGLSPRRSVLFLWGMGVVGAAVAVAFRVLPEELSSGLALVCLLAAALLLIYLAHVTVGRPRHLLEPQPLPLEFLSSHPAYLAVLDIVLLAAAYDAAFLIRFQGPQFAHFRPYFLESFPVVVALQFLGLWIGGNDRRATATARPHDLWKLTKGALIGIGASVIALLSWRRFQGDSRWVFALDAVLAPAFVIGSRMLLGYLDQALRPDGKTRRPAFVYGAGKAGGLAIRELAQNPDLQLVPVGIIDDDASTHGHEIEGVLVFGGIDRLSELLAIDPRRVSAVVIAIRDLPSGQLERISAICDEHEIELHRMRFSLEPIERRDRGASIVKFPGA